MEGASQDGDRHRQIGYERGGCRKRQRLRIRQWLYGPTIEAAARDGADFKEVQKLQAEFHKAAAQVLQLALQGKKTEAKKLLAQGGTFADVSAQLTSAMMRWQKSAA